MLSMMVMIAAPQTVDLIGRAAELTAVERCPGSDDSTDITVCGLRDADRFRVPFIVREPGDQRFRSVAAERETLIHRRTPMEEMGPFLVEGGMAGVTVRSGSGSTEIVGYRPLAP